ncbi:hypothetical protein BJY04DRAFT_222620 [Aspergillus karnatakaensis]|uniref:uncharacterized protein n=1 Tax=Aspergillus karnatakaensis TaxID=1810916 RepID=UPI003CCCFE0A
MTTPEREEPGAKRRRNFKRASMACIGCKRSKRKCDIASRLAESEGCTTCTKKGEACEVRYGEDKRRKRSAAVDVDLQARISALEGLLLQRTGTAASTPRASDLGRIVAGGTTEPEDGHVARLTGHETELSSGTGIKALHIISPLPEHAASRVHNSQSSIELDRGGEDVLNGESHHTGHSSTKHHAVPDRRNSLRTSRPGSVGDMSYTDDGSSIINKVISRDRCLDAQRADKHAYFGSTSIFHLLNTLERNTHSQRAGQPAVEANDPDLDYRLEPEPVVSHLLELFWDGQASHIQVVPRRQFLAHKDAYETGPTNNCQKYQFFSPSLLFAIMSLAAMISLQRGVRHQSTSNGGIAGDVYFRKAKQLFDQEIGRPRITTIQTALLLGSRYGALGHHSLGWTYSGIALRMAVELGLHLKYQVPTSHDLLS